YIRKPRLRRGRRQSVADLPRRRSWGMEAAMSLLENTAEAPASRSVGAPSGRAFLVTLSCPDRIGIVADVSRFLVDHGANILESAQYGDAGNGAFFLRTAFEPAAGEGLAGMEAAVGP